MYFDLDYISQVYDPSFLIETRRPFAQWELAQDLVLTSSRTESVGANVHPEEGLEETVAETMTADGTIVGRWIVKWGADGAGTCHQMGHIVRWVKFFMRGIVDMNFRIPLDISMSMKSCCSKFYLQLQNLIVRTYLGVQGMSSYANQDFSYLFVIFSWACCILSFVKNY